MAGKILESRPFPNDSDVLMTDPFLEYINGLLMDEDTDDASYLQQVQDGPASSSYQAIFSSLQDIIADTASASHDRDEFAYNVEGTPQYEAIFSSLQEIIQPASAPNIRHPPTNPQQEIGPGAKLPYTTIMELCTTTNRGYNSCSSEKVDAVAQNYLRIVQSNAGLLMDAMASCPGKDAVAQGDKGQEQAGKAAVTAQDHKGQKQGNGTFKPPASADEQFSSDQVTALDLSFEDLKLDDVYTSLYVEEPSSSTTASRNGRHKQKSTTGKGRFCKQHTSNAPVFIDVREVLISCAEAVAIGDARRANRTLQEIHKVYGASAHGTGLQRITYIFSRALAARLRGTGVQEFEAMSRDMPSSASVLRAAKLDFEVIPYKKLVHFYANQSIVQAADGASRLHIVDYGLVYGLQWPCLINALANRKGSPPLLVITFIEFPQPGLDVARRLHESGRRLAAYAKMYNVPFQYHVIVSDKWEDLDAASLRLCSDQPEVLVVNCMMRLRHVADNTTTSGKSTISARQKLLAFWRSLNPHLLVTTVVNGAHNSPFFVTRFREALDFFTNWFDMLDTLWGDIPERHIMERGLYYPSIMNIVACEGAERLERSENYRQWHAHITEAGFEQVSSPSTILARSKLHVKEHYHKDFLIYDDEKGWMLQGWKGRALFATSAWKPALPVS